jgi:UDP-2-acetamido-3-amino-2,3-dideoxy-glucuronate N-acetyltransferase
MNRQGIDIAVVGLGQRGQNLARTLHAIGALAALCDNRSFAEEACARDYPGVRFFTDYTSMLSDSSIHGVALATPSATHFDMAKAALEAGKDVLVETPIAVDLKQGEHLVEIAAANKRILMIGHIFTGNGPVTLDAPQSHPEKKALPYFVHPSAYVDEGAEVGAGSKVWHFSHVMKGAKIGTRTNIGQNVNIDGGTVIGNNVKIQNNVSVYTGIVVEDDVFLGPSCVLTNVSNPRSQVNRHSLYETTTLKRGCSVGANATVVCGVTIGRYVFVGAGSVVTKNLPDYALVVGNPARRIAWISRHGHRLENPDSAGVMRCPESGYCYKETDPGLLRCLDLDEDAPLPAEFSKGSKSYGQFKEEAKHECSVARS